MNWTNRQVRWIVKYGTNTVTIFIALVILLILLVLSQFLKFVSIGTVFNITVVGALLEIMLMLIGLEEQKQIGIEIIDELPALVTLVKQSGAAKVYCLANTLSRSNVTLTDLVEKTNVEVYVICSNPDNVVEKYKPDLIYQAKILFQRLHKKGRFHLYFTTNTPTVPGWVLVDHQENPILAIVGWYTYLKGDTDIDSRNNPRIKMDPAESSFA
jgi:hypothetical protein